MIGSSNFRGCLLYTSEKETAEFLNRMEQQTKKLDFLIQSMVKMSRLETGIIEIRKKDVSVYDTKSVSYTHLDVYKRQVCSVSSHWVLIA